MFFLPSAPAASLVPRSPPAREGLDVAATGRCGAYICDVVTLRNLYIFTSGCQDHTMYRVVCPVWKQEYGCSGVRRRTWPDSINSLCPKTCGLCGNINNILSLPSERWRDVELQIQFFYSAVCPTKLARFPVNIEGASPSHPSKV